jgi:uncharacterized damage-inducible protein DinB
MASIIILHRLGRTSATSYLEQKPSLRESTMTDAIADRFRQWFEYERDAHAKVAQSLQTVPDDRRGSPEFKKAVGWLAHLAMARRIWLERLGVLPAQARTMFPDDADLGQVLVEVQAVEELWLRYLASLTDSQLAETIEYKSLDAGRFRNRVEDILTQLFGHSWYHRGQIASLIRAAGGEPAATDYIFWCREPIAET